MGQLVNWCYIVTSCPVLNVPTCPLSITCSEIKKRLVLNIGLMSIKPYIYLEIPQFVKCLHMKRKSLNEVEIYFRGTKKNFFSQNSLFAL